MSLYIWQHYVGKIMGTGPHGSCCPLVSKRRGIECFTYQQQGRWLLLRSYIPLRVKWIESLQAKSHHILNQTETERKIKRIRIDFGWCLRTGYGDERNKKWNVATTGQCRSGNPINDVIEVQTQLWENAFLYNKGTWYKAWR